MKALTVSAITLGMAATMGISARDVSGDHGPSDVQTRIEPDRGPTTTEIPRLETSDVAPTSSGCKIERRSCKASACFSSRRAACRVAPAKVAVKLHTLALILAEDVDFDLYGTRVYTHLFRDAESVVRDVISVRRSLARQSPREAVTADLRNISSSLKHLNQSLGRQYRTRAIHFALMDTESALDELTMALGLDLRSETNQPPDFETLGKPTRNRPESNGSPIPRASPQSQTPPVPPSFRPAPERLPVAPNALVIPEPAVRPAIPEDMKGLRQLTIPEQRLALKQRTCPVTGDLLGSMGKPLTVKVNGRVIFVCCQGCVEELQSPR